MRAQYVPAGSEPDPVLAVTVNEPMALNAPPAAEISIPGVAALKVACPEIVICVPALPMVAMLFVRASPFIPYAAEVTSIQGEGP